ncbi:hypothetical protein SBF1_3770008 [Candidatus Desulfosporosinus infrequens]|uniref:Uncharacterized protein n=1 Tax=Candidatus Desulfosporosinus infrequens TaxID=2043169 RepID=A0A2U3L585_9FIRM|nr:hypothetical protein SBF1_3770008 [Candidatus Desulfosporosinus infrequens]
MGGLLYLLLVFPKLSASPHSFNCYSTLLYSGVALKYITKLDAKSI